MFITRQLQFPRCNSCFGAIKRRVTWHFVAFICSAQRNVVPYRPKKTFNKRRQRQRWLLRTSRGNVVQQIIQQSIADPWDDEYTYCNPAELRMFLHTLLIASQASSYTARCSTRSLWQDAWAFLTQRYELALANDRCQERAVWDRMLLCLYGL